MFSFNLHLKEKFSCKCTRATPPEVNEIRVHTQRAETVAYRFFCLQRQLPGILPGIFARARTKDGLAHSIQSYFKIIMLFFFFPFPNYERKLQLFGWKYGSYLRSRRLKPIAALFSH